MAEKHETYPPRFGFTVARRVVQIGIIVLFLLPVFLSEVEGDFFVFGTLSSSQIFGISLLDPFSALQVMLSSKSLLAPKSLLAFAIILVFYALIRGRVFCGWVCPINLILEGVDYLTNKTGLIPRSKQAAGSPISRRTKIAISVGVLVLSFLFSIPVFDMLSPVSAISKLLVLGSTVGLFSVLAVIILQIAYPGRIWCRSLCPLGGFYESISRMGLLGVKTDYEKCTHCDLCKHVCLADPQILDAPLYEGARGVYAGDCMACGKCVDVCPTKALSFTVGNFRRQREDGEQTAATS